MARSLIRLPRLGAPRLRPQRAITAMLLAIVAVAAGVAATTGAEATATVSDSPWVTYAKFSPLTPLRERPKDVQELASRATELTDAHKDKFLGTYVDPSNRVVVVPADEAGTRMAQSEFSEGEVVVASSAISSQEAADLGDALFKAVVSLGADMVFWGGHPESGGALIVVRRDPTDEETRDLELFADEHKIPLRIEVWPGAPTMTLAVNNRLVDPSPYAGGARIGLGDGPLGSGAHIHGLCTTGFGYLRNGYQAMVTAGHCFPRNSTDSYMWILTLAGGKAEYAGQRSFSSWDDGVGSLRLNADNDFHGDVALVNVSNQGNEAGDHIWWGTTDTMDKIPVTARHAPVVADDVCFSGFVSGSDCGLQVYATNTTASVYDGDGHFTGTARQVDISISIYSYDCPQPGDSGSPVVLDHGGAETFADAKGIVSASGSSPSFPCIMGSTGVEEVVQAWGGDLAFH